MATLCVIRRAARLALPAILFTVITVAAPMAARAEVVGCTAGNSTDNQVHSYSSSDECEGPTSKCKSCSSFTDKSAIDSQSKSDSSSQKSTEAKLSYPLDNPLKAKSLPEAIGRATQIFIGVAGSLALLAFVWGGLLMLTSGGKEDRVTKGKQILVMATVGLIVIFTSYALLKVFLSVFGLS